MNFTQQLLVPFLYALSWNPTASSEQTCAIDSAPTEYSLPSLPYAYDALAPYISSQIMTLHHSKHHQTYVTNLNKALSLESSLTESADIPTRIANQQAIKFNGGGHINHSLFWKSLVPASSPHADTSNAPNLAKALNADFGGLEKFKDKFSAALLGIQGSGWGWLVKGVENGKLDIVTTKDQDPVEAKYVPILGVDMWEHAYYLQYLNGKADYVKNIWNIINWNEAEVRFEGGRADVFQVLQSKI
ncbi:manganese and iron superoxide dismutase [Viridothelium virens]|uniref:Superoxide dismutase n=1 Tax=Viridothelium virens TaxID=1048519 RepID=A0A6A6HGM8_VIRVR|nr:manganese and iron superoxide dismutase [Viridothelium virens]